MFFSFFFRNAHPFRRTHMMFEFHMMSKDISWWIKYVVCVCVIWGDWYAHSRYALCAPAFAYFLYRIYNSDKNTHISFLWVVFVLAYFALTGVHQFFFLLVFYHWKQKQWHTFKKFYFLPGGEKLLRWNISNQSVKWSMWIFEIWLQNKVLRLLKTHNLFCCCCCFKVFHSKKVVRLRQFER